MARPRLLRRWPTKTVRVREELVCLLLYQVLWGPRLFSRPFPKVSLTEDGCKVTMHSSSARILQLAWVTVLGCGLVLAAAGDEPLRLPAFSEVVDVRVINLEVVVSRGGQRVSGLGATDFRLLVDGEEVPIEYFSEVASGRVVAESQSTAASAAGPRVPLALTPGEAVGNRYLVFIDDDFSLPSTRN